MLATISTLRESTIAQEIMRIIVGVTFLSVCAQISIPIEPVPISLQTIALMAIALLYSMPSGIKTVLSYITIGALGLPVFANYNAGPQVLIGTTGGYLLGFVICVWLMNKLKGLLGTKTTVGVFLNCMAGTTVIFACGISWLAMYIGWNQAIISGLLPFIIPGLLKAIILTIFLRSLGMLRTLTNKQ